MALEREIMVMDLVRHKKAAVPASPLTKRSPVEFPLRDRPPDKSIGKRISAPRKNRKKAICITPIGGDINLTRISLMAKKNADKIIIGNPLDKNIFTIQNTSEYANIILTGKAFERIL
jgi:hypothetical protein